MKKLNFSIAFVLTYIVIFSNSITQAQNVFYVDSSTTYVLPGDFNPIPVGGDTIKILSDRTETLKFKGFEGNENNPIVFINDGGQVHINTTAWGALTFEDCKYIKVSGKGNPDVNYGFKLLGRASCLSFLNYSSDCEVENTEMYGNTTTFFGIYAKKDFSGNPPEPYPIFKNLSIHDSYIHDLGEGMYIGETTSPGMEFRHLRVYNNIVVNTLRESVQIANSVDDVEIYNNFFLNAGLENILYQQNSLQIGNNSIAKVYNNVIINAPANGIILLGNGDISVTNNFIRKTNGIFIDDRYEIIPYSPISIERNFFDDVTNSQVIQNMNEYNELYIRNNDYNTDITFFENSVESIELVVVENNLFSTISDFKYTLENGIFENSTENPLLYQSMGPQIGLGHIFNDSPELQSIDSILIEYSTNNIINLNATVGDQDNLHFEGKDLPPFAQIHELSSGNAELIINPQFDDIGVYEFGIMVYDESHLAYDRQIVQLSVMNPDNHAPILNFETELNIEGASKFQLDITAVDADNDSIFYTANPLPPFARIVSNDNQILLELQPKISDTGQYVIEIIADDGYGIKATQQLSLNITQVVLTSGRVIYRVNYGGPEIVGEPINWEVDLLNSEPAYSTTYFLRTGSWSWNGINTTSAPNNLFGPFRYDAAGGTEMQFAFPLSANGQYHVKLFFAERSTEVDANLTGTFNILAENQIVLENFNIYQTALYEANEQSFDVFVEDLILNIDFQQIENNAKINGIEISYLGEGIAINQAPEIQTLSQINLNENDTLEIPINIIDDDSESCNSISIESSNIPDFATILENTEGEFSLLLQPSYDQSGTYENIVLTAFDGCLYSEAFSIVINVLNNNRPPILNPIEITEIEAASKFQLDITADDADNDSLSYSINSIPSFAKMIIVNDQVLLEFQPQIGDTGSYVLEIIADDGYGTPASRTLNLNITQPTLTTGRLIYRVNFGGPEIEAEPINWEADLVNSIAAYSTTYFLRTGSWSWSGINTTSAPNNLFGPFRYDAAGGTEMQFAFPLSANGQYQVKLFFAERSTEVDANLTGTFNVFSENQIVLENFNIYQTALYEANEQSFEVAVDDMILNLDFNQIENNTKINGIEIIYLGDIAINQAPEIQTLNQISLNENDALEIPINIIDDDFESCNSISIQSSNIPDFAIILENIEGEFSLLLKPNYDQSGTYENIILTAFDGCLYSEAFSIDISVINTNRAPVLSAIDLIEMEAGNTLSIDIMATDVDGDQISFQLENAPLFIELIDISNGLAELQLNPSIADAGNFSFNITASDQNQGSSILNIDVQITSAPVPVSERIILNTTMVTDMVSGGSRDTPLNLTNEQYLDPYLNQHPRSKSWVPSKYIDGSPFYALIDLGGEFYIDFAFVHDMKNSGDLHFSVGTPDNWNEITIINTSSFKQWHEVNIQNTSRYLLLSMYNTVYAQINEIALYGYPILQNKRSNAIEDQAIKSFDFNVYPNPARKQIRIANKSPEQTVVVLSIVGKTLLRTNDEIIDIAYLPNGIYLLRLYNENDLIYQSKFIKSE